MKLLCIATLLSVATGAKILGICPSPSISHQLPFRLIMQALHARGHELTVITTDPIKKNLTNYEEIDVSFAYEYLRSTYDFTSMTEDTPLDMVDNILTIGVDVCDIELKSPQVQNLVKSGRKFDVVILEALAYEGFYGLVHAIGSPLLVGFLSLGMWIPVHDAIGSPTSPAFCPEFMLAYSDRMTFWQRFYSSYFHYFVSDKWENEHLDAQESIIRKYFGQGSPPIRQMKNNYSLILVNNHWSINYPRPFMPNVVELTGLHILEEREPLPTEIGSFIEGADDGVIYFSLGSNVNSSALPMEKRVAFLEAFTELPQRVLWKWGTDVLEEKPDNVYVSKWFPQQDVLAHPKVKLFITQGGLQSVNEAGYFGVPMIAIPFFADQWHNVAKVVQAGIGVQLDLKDVSKDSLLKTIKAVLHETEHRRSMESFSEMYREEPRLSIERAVWWVEYVLRHNGTQHLRSATLDIHWIQILGLDTGLAVAAAISIVVIISRRYSKSA